ncbi:MAG: response regulator transcription factor [Actinomycetota bacterium]
MSTVLVVEDDAEIRTALERILRYESYEVISAVDGAEGLEKLTDASIDCVVLDLMLPYVDGLTVCRRMRARGDRTPVLMLTARGDVRDRVEGLDAGADDYLPKPFDLDELLARIRALLRRTSELGEDVLVSGSIRLDPLRREVAADNEPVQLTRTEFEILHLLMRNEGIVLERSVMYERIWGYDFEGASRSLDVHVGYLRRKLEATGLPRSIETVRGIGFVLRPKAGP